MDSFTLSSSTGTAAPGASGTYGEALSFGLQGESWRGGFLLDKEAGRSHCYFTEPSLLQSADAGAINLDNTGLSTQKIP